MQFNREDAEKFFKFLNHVKFTEVRIIDPREGLKEVAFLDNLTDFLAICEKWNGKANIYVGVSARSSKEGKAENVATLEIIPLDIDPVRPKGEASTDAELEIARQKMLQIKSWLKEKFDCTPFVTMSGNGYHLFIKIPSITLDEFNRTTLEEKLTAFIHEIQAKFNDDSIHIDSTGDLPRVMKVAGTMSVKGANTTDRPWRMCKIVEPNNVACAQILTYLGELKTKKVESEELGHKTQEEFDALLEKDKKLRDLFEGKWKEYGFTSRSEGEQSLVTKLIVNGFSAEAINSIMNRCKIGKWVEKGDAYHRTCIEKATKFVKKHKESLEPKKTEFTWEEIGDPITFEEWRKTINENFPELWPYAEACASTVGILLIKDVQPLALVLQGVPGSGKTTTLDFFKKFPLSHSTDKFTPRAFVSHVAQKTEEELAEIDLLPRIKDKVLISPDLTTLFGGKPEEIKETFSILTRVLDGQGLVIDSGVYGGRGYQGDYMFVWIGATTPIPHIIWDLFGNLGARMYFQSVPKKPKTTQKYIMQIKEKSYRKKVTDCNSATMRFLKSIWREDKIEWNSKEDSDLVLERIVSLAKLVTRLRGKISVALKQEFGGEKMYYSEPIIEEPERCIQAFYTLMRGHALIKGRTQVAIDDVPIIIDVALSSAPWDRIFAFAYLLNKEEVTTNELVKDLPCSRYKAVRTMKTLELLDIVTLEEERIATAGGEQMGYTMRLKPDFHWFTTEEFKRLWRTKLSDIVKPTEELTEPEFEKSQKEAVGLEPFIKIFKRRIPVRKRARSIE